MSEFKKHINIESTATLYSSLDTDNITKLFKNKEVKSIIYNFYIKENAGFTNGIDKLLAEKNDYTVRFIMLQLLKELKYKEQFGELNGVEQKLTLVFSNDLSKQNLKNEYSDALVTAFKNVLKEIFLS
ncbi:hypothetical protein [Bacillus cereus]|uniref:Uncharacterized protein n=1 Tax=Bacillus cereus 03BB108 TaxID=451709 RepID=A0AAN0W4U9_BACCE|nr:hypothetical protein [Bacillus cereus]AJI08712.1 hypothetical protein AK40_5652 [Bacillus cereus 03BB108]EDX59819.1 hypothetical protein BC03BB108_B0294 [Bacillus cereus 03BB108]QKG99130.1 hypothetical protein FOC96_02430 [Bacillus cereus]